MSEPTLHPPDFTTYNPQSASPLFATLPPELRSLIFTYALSPYEDTSRTYARETYWTRPGYSAPHKTSTSILRTCKAAYAETWFLPFALAEHAFYLTARDRAPRNLSHAGFQPCLELIRKIHGEFETGHLRIFAQLYILEPGDALQQVLDTEYLAPRRVSLTLRYTDFWHWEDNRRLWVDPRWVNRVRFPESVSRFVVDFESLERRKEEIDIITGQAVEGWVFRRRDGKVLTARKEDVVVTRWTGSSTLGGRRWVRDEVRPGELDYYVVTVTWKLSRSAEEDGVDLGVPCPKIQVPDDYVQPPPPYLGWSSLPESELRMAGVTSDMQATDAVAVVQAYRANSAAASARSRSIGSSMRLRDRIGRNH
ncbi:hypothetical protein BDV12DRAFT_205850 [Aspergillus spectabilis]